MQLMCKRTKNNILLNKRNYKYFNTSMLRLRFDSSRCTDLTNKTFLPISTDKVKHGARARPIIIYDYMVPINPRLGPVTSTPFRRQDLFLLQFVIFFSLSVGDWRCVSFRALSDSSFFLFLVFHCLNVARGNTVRCAMCWHIGVHVGLSFGTCG